MSGGDLPMNRVWWRVLTAVIAVTVGLVGPVSAASAAEAASQPEVIKLDGNRISIFALDFGPDSGRLVVTRHQRTVSAVLTYATGVHGAPLPGGYTMTLTPDSYRTALQLSTVLGTAATAQSAPTLYHVRYALNDVATSWDLTLAMSMTITADATEAVLAFAVAFPGNPSADGTYEYLRIPL